MRAHRQGCLIRLGLLVAVASLGLAAAPGTARAQSASGDDLLWVCEHYGCEKEIILLTQAVMRDQKTGASYTVSDPVCFRQETTWSEIVAVVQTGLKAHPETRQRDVHALVLSYLSAAFPCVPT